MLSRSPISFLIVMIAMTGMIGGPIHWRLSAAEPIDTRLLNPWNDPKFIKTFTDDLALRTEIEPSISPEEKLLIAKTVPQISQNPAEAFRSLASEISNESSAALDFILGHLSNVLGDRQRDVGFYTKAVEKFPNFLRAHKWLGHFYFEHEDFDRATESYVRVLSLSGNEGDEFVHGRLAYSLLYREEFVSAETAFRAAAVANPGNTRWKSGLAHCLVNLDQPQAALAIVKEILAQEPGDQNHWLLKANAHLAATQPRQALAAFEAARRLRRPGTEILTLIGDLYLNEGLIPPAVANYRSALQENPAAAGAGILRAIEALIVRAQLNPARELLASYQELVSKQTTATNQDRLTKLQLWIDLAQNPGESIFTTMETFLDRHPLDTDSLIRLADAYSLAEKYPQAQQTYLQALRIDDTNVTILSKLAQLQAQQRHFAEALKTIQSALQLAPNPALESYARQLEQLTQNAAESATP